MTVPLSSSCIYLFLLILHQNFVNCSVIAQAQVGRVRRLGLKALPQPNHLLRQASLSLSKSVGLYSCDLSLLVIQLSNEVETYLNKDSSYNSYKCLGVYLLNLNHS